MNGILQFWGDAQDLFQPFAGPGHWNDPDQIIVGDFGLSPSEAQMQFGMWAMFAAPLYMSNDLRSIYGIYSEILLNKEVIAIDQDPLGVQATCIYNNCTFVSLGCFC